MKPYLHDNRDEFNELIDIVSEEMNIPADAVLRDYYITLLLHNLARSEYKEVCIFKGGTSLSKCYPGTIERFSEDIDLTYTDTEGKNDKKISKTIKKIEKVITEGFESEPINEERSSLSKSMDVWNSQEERKTSVKLEIGAKINPLPVIEKMVRSYIHEYLVENQLDEVLLDYYFPDVHVRVLDVTRTFIDKVYAVKTQALVGDLSVKVRHVYDVVQLFKHTEIQSLFLNREQLKLIISYAESASAFYVLKRGKTDNESLYGLYGFERWQTDFNKPQVRKAYEKLHEELLYTNEKQSFDVAIQTFETINEKLNGLAAE